jgi:hypothetical protein
MIWLICFLIIHIVSSILAKRVIVNLLEYYGKGLKVFNDEKITEYGIEFLKKIIPHFPIINIIFAYMYLKIYVLHFLNNKKNKQ